MSARKRPPHFIGIGAQHAGLGMVASWLREHSEIGGTVPALNFFSTDAFTKKGLDWYESALYEGMDKKARLVGECSAQYLYDAATAERISRNYPDTKLFVILRHPVYRLLAEYEARREIDREALHIPIVPYVAKHPGLFARSQYALALKSYFGYYSPRQLEIIWYEDIAASPLTTVQALYQFLGVKSDFVPRQLRAYAPPKEEPKNPGLLKRSWHQIHQWYQHFHTTKGQMPVFPPDTTLDYLLSESERHAYEQALLPGVDELSHLVSRDMATYWSLREDVNTRL
jgi:hypothetical protein